MRRICLALAVSAGLLLPSTASAGVVAGAGVLDFGFFSGGAHVNIHAGVTVGGAPLGVLAYSFLGYPGAASSLAGAGQLTCLRVEGNKASMKFRSPTAGSFGTSVLWIEDRGLLGLFGARDRAAGRTIFPPDFPDLGTCPPVTAPSGYQEVTTGDFTVLDVL